jgi:hypothetical protein
LHLIGQPEREHRQRRRQRVSKDPTGKFGDIPDCWPKWVSFDPGVTTGVTLWNEVGKPIHYNELDIDNLHKFLDRLEICTLQSNAPIKRLIVEEYRLYQSKALQQSGSYLVTVQVIGMIKRSNYVMRLEPVVEVRADNKEIAAKWAGQTIPRGHMPNWMASYLIGYWWLHKVVGIIPARVLEKS